MTTVDLYPYLILVGGSILAATFWLLSRARAQARQSQKLVKLNEALHFDLPDFLSQCWPLLEAGGISGFSWHMSWFGTSMSKDYGTRTDNVLSQHFDMQEIVLNVYLFHHSKGWERRYFTQLLADSLFLLLRMDIWIKLGMIHGTFDQTAKMNVFLQHDMKNLVQLVSLAAEQVRDVKPGQELSVLSALQRSMPAMEERVKHALHMLVLPQPRQYLPIPLAPMLANIAETYALEVDIAGSATVSLPKDVLRSIFDNLLGNYSLQARKSDNSCVQLQIVISVSGSRIVLEFEDRLGEPFLRPERLFEPFWSERGSGRGIGLYQSQQMAESLGGTLTALAPEDGPLKFVLTLKDGVPASAAGA